MLTFPNMPGQEAASGTGPVLPDNVAGQNQPVRTGPSIAEPANAKCISNGDAGPEVLLASRPEDADIWANLVSRSATPDVYFRPGYAAAYSDDRTRALAVVITTSTRRFLIPLLLREVTVVQPSSSVPDYDAITPYGYGGVLPLERGEVTSRDASELVDKLAQWCKKGNVVSCMLRLHPLLAQHSGFSTGLAGHPGRSVRSVGPTVAIDLLSWDDALCGPAGMNKGRRSDLLYARRHLTVRLAPCHSSQSREMLRQFRSIYDETMTRLNAKSFYFFPEEYFTFLQDALRGDMIVAVAYQRGQAVSAALFLADSQFGHYHLSGVTPEGKKHKAQTMVLVEAAQWMRKRGCCWLHLGGGRALADSLYYFKRSFGTTEFNYSYITLITNRARYDELVRARGAQSEPGTSLSDFFPAYRGSEQ